MARRRASRCGMRLGSALRWLLLSFFLFGWFFNPAQPAEDFLALLGRLTATGELHGKDLFDNLLKFRASGHS